MKDRITTAEASKRLGVTTTRVRAMLKAGILAGEPFGRDWMIDAASVAKRKRLADKGKLPKGGAGMHKDK